LIMISYLCETYDKHGKLLPLDPAQRVKVRQWVHASEATFALHALAILYARWHIQGAPEGLCGDHITAADIMMQFSADFILARELGTQGKEWPNINKWLEACKKTDTYQRAVKKTGHKL
jgi:glutathione S-transferase